MIAREDVLEQKHAPHTPTALFDELGKLRGWSPEFGDICGLTTDLAERTTSDFWPDIDAGRWADIWRRIQADSSALVIHVEECRPTEGNELVELEIGRFIEAGQPLAKVEVRRSAAWRLHLMQQEILETMACGAHLSGIMEALCRKVEMMAPSVICSVLRVDHQQRLQHVASPSLPLHYARAIDGLQAGPKAGSCGTAVYRGEAVEVVDIAADPLWDDYRHLVLPLGLQACWSSPIKSPDGHVLGAFAFYYPRPRGPTLLERQIVSTCLHLCMIAFEQEETRARVYEHAFTDPLTHLPNRARFRQRVSERLAIVAETGQRVAVQYIGLDGFRVINDALGHQAGDEILKVVADRLASVVRDSDGVARIGGDEFAIVQAGNLSDDDIANRAKRIVDLLAEPFISSGQRLQLGASIGIAIGPDDAAGADDLIHDAALAMRRVKELGRGAYFFYEKELNERMQRRRRVEADLRSALARDELELHFQPIFDLTTGTVIEAEALLRWNHPEKGVVLPSEFIPIAEQCGLIEQVGAWVLRKACLEAVKWPQQVTVAVNLSPLQFDSPDLAQTVASALEASGLSPSRLELEVTESVLLRDSPVYTALLDKLSDLGVSIALDDFGSGYSSLSYLHRFSFDRIKIDHSFIRDIARNQGSLKIVRAIVMLAHSLGLEVTAEGVETDEQLAAVRGEGCDAVQGYYTGAPVPMTEFTERLSRGGERVSAA